MWHGLTSDRDARVAKEPTRLVLPVAYGFESAVTNFDCHPVYTFEEESLAISALRFRCLLWGRRRSSAYRPIDRMLLRRDARAAAPFKKQYALGVALGACMTILEMLSPKFMQWIIDYGVSFQKHVLPNQPTSGGAIRHVLAIIAFWAVCLIAAIVPAALHDPGHDRGGRARAVLHPPTALRALRPVDELLRPHQARPHHQPLHQRHQRACAR